MNTRRRIRPVRAAVSRLVHAGTGSTAARYRDIEDVDIGRMDRDRVERRAFENGVADPLPAKSKVGRLEQAPAWSGHQRKDGFVVRRMNNERVIPGDVCAWLIVGEREPDWIGIRPTPVFQTPPPLAPTYMVSTFPGSGAATSIRPTVWPSALVGVSTGAGPIGIQCVLSKFMGTSSD